MRIPSPITYCVGSAAALALLAGCSGGGGSQPGSPVALQPGAGGSSLTRAVRHIDYSVVAPAARAIVRKPTHQQPFVDVAAVQNPGGDQVLVSDFVNNSVTVLGGGGKVNALLTSGLVNPEGLLTDASGTLYVANAGASNILVYPKPYTSSTLTISDPNEFPSDVAITPDGTLAASNIENTFGGAGGVSIYAKGSTTACANVTDPNWFQVYFIASDKSGNLYIDGHDLNNNTLVGEVTGECGATAITTLSTTNVIAFPGAVQVTNKGDIAILDQTSAAIDTYAPPSGGSLGSPLLTTPISGAGDPVAFSLKQHDQNFWVVDAINVDAVKFPYPAGGSPIRTFTAGFGEPTGIAVNPAQP